MQYKTQFRESGDATVSLESSDPKMDNSWNWMWIFRVLSKRLKLYNHSDTTSHPYILESSAKRLWEPQISQINTRFNVAKWVSENTTWRYFRMEEKSMECCYSVWWGQWQVQLVLLYVKEILWLQSAALVLTSYTKSAGIGTDYTANIAASAWLQNCTLGESNNN